MPLPWGAPLRYVLLAGLVLALLTVLGALALQWHRFTEGMGAFRCYVREPGASGSFGRWRRGAARFDTTALRWFPDYVLLASRSLVLDRKELELSGRWPAGEDEGVPRGLTVLRGSVRGRTVDLAVAGCTASALVLWVESGPPGRGVDVV